MGNYKPECPLLTVDCVVRNPKDEVLLIKRKNPPFKGKWALPGGYVDIGETVEAACRRELVEETNIQVNELRLVGVYSEPQRDPRGHVVSVAFVAKVSNATLPCAGDDAASARFIDWTETTLAFDHEQIIKDALALVT